MPSTAVRSRVTAAKATEGCAKGAVEVFVTLFGKALLSASFVTATSINAFIQLVRNFCVPKSGPTGKNARVRGDRKNDALVSLTVSWY